MWPGNGIRAIYQTATDLRAQAFREGRGGNRANYLHAYVGDTLSAPRMTITAGVRFDRQWGSADASTTESNPAFPALVPGIVFPGYRAPFTWNNLSPRASFTYSLDESHKTNARVSYSSSAGQLATSTIGFMNPASGLGAVTYRWADANGDRFAQANEVDTTQVLSTSGINVNNPTAVISPNQVDPNLTAPVTRTFVAGLDRELMPHLAVQAAYTYSRNSNLFGNSVANITPRVGVPLDGGYTTGPTLTGTLPDGSALQRADVRPDLGARERWRRRLPDDERAGLLHRLQRRRAGDDEAPLEQMDGPRVVRVQQRARALRRCGGTV